MKKTAFFIAALTILGMLLTGCGTEKENVSGGAENAGTGVDVDLSALGESVRYAEVYNILFTPDKYMGKTIRMKGRYFASYFEPTKSYYHYVTVGDATGCCQQGFEFIWGEHAYPGDYPANEAEVEVTGVFGAYVEQGITYYYISADSLIVQ